MHIRRGFAVALGAVVGIGLLPGLGAVPATAASADLFFSEYVEGSSNNKALEIYNDTGAPVDLEAGGYQVQMYFNGSTTPGLSLDLEGVVPSGDVFVLAHSSAAPAILAQADQTNGAGWFNGDDAVVLRGGGAVLDVVGQIGHDPGSQWGADLTSTQDNTLRRNESVTAGDPDGSDAFDPAQQWTGYATDTFDGLGAYGAGPVTDPTDPPGDPAPSCEADITSIPTIQGSGAAAAVTGPVATRGVVVGDYEGGSGTLRGFYLQDLEGDGDPATSDGIFVFNGSADDVAVGDLVAVAGDAEEFHDQTQIGAGAADDVLVCSSGHSVTPAEVRLPFADAGAPERFEGMLVTLPQTLSVTETFRLGRFGQVLLSSDGRLAQPTNVVAPGAAANELQAANQLNQILVDDASQEQNPDPILFARGGEPLSADNTLRGGDTATGTVGVMTYTWGGQSSSPDAYRVRPVDALGGHVLFEPANERPAAPEPVGGDLRVASFNVLNFFNTFNDRDTQGDDCRGGTTGSPMDCRGADDAFELERQADKIVAAIAGLDADVVGVIEIENDGYGPDSALRELVDRLNADAGAGTWAFLDVDARTGETDALGDDAIKVGLLYKPDAVTPVGRTAVLNTPSFVNGASGEPRNRPALAQTFQDDDGGRATVVVNHLKSKGSDCEDDGDPDTGDGQGNCNQTRLDAAVEMAAWLAGDPTAVDDTDVLIMGDLNSYAMEDPITALKDRGYTDLVRTFEGEDAYSYVFDGQWGYLDHALASSSLAGQVTGTTTWHINADEPPVLDYNDDFKSDDQVTGLYAPGPYRSSDHDPVLVGLDLTVGRRVSEGFVTGSGSFTTAAGTGSFDLSALYTPGAEQPAGTVEASIPGVGAVEVAELAWVSTDVEKGLATLSGPATLDGRPGYVLTVEVTDAAAGDRIRFVLQEAEQVLHDTGVVTVVEGNLTVHARPGG